MKWKTIKGYINYQISETGEIRSEKIVKKGKLMFKTYRSITPSIVGNGKLQAITLYGIGSRKTVLVHNLYSETWGVSKKDASRIVYEGFKGSDQAKKNIKMWLNEKIAECEIKQNQGNDLNDEILYLKKFLKEI